jgi:hypothetical protein
MEQPAQMWEVPLFIYPLSRTSRALPCNSLSAKDLTSAPVKAGHELVFAALRQSLIVKQ